MSYNHYPSFKTSLSKEWHQNMKWFDAGTKKMSVSTFGTFIKLMNAQSTKTWVSPRDRCTSDSPECQALRCSPGRNHAAARRVSTVTVPVCLAGAATATWTWTKLAVPAAAALPGPLRRPGLTFTLLIMSLGGCTSESGTQDRQPNSESRRVSDRVRVWRLTLGQFQKCGSQSHGPRLPSARASTLHIASEFLFRIMFSDFLQFWRKFCINFVSNLHDGIINSNFFSQIWDKYGTKCA